MASLFAGEPLQAPSYAATTTDVPKWLQDYTVDLFSQQRAVAGTPYQSYALPRIAETTAPTTAAQNLITSSSGAYQPTVQNAISGTQGLAGATSVGNINAYMNPYTQNVTDQIAKLGARNLSENLLPQVSDQFIRAGQFGSSGMGTFGNRALRDTQEAILANQATALNTGYNQALGASAADLTRQQGALSQTGDLAKLQQGLITADAAALESVGATQQAQQQKGLDVAYQDFLRQQGYPQEQINNMSATLRGLPASATPTTGTSTGSTTQFTPSPLSQVAGAFATYKGLTSAKGGLIDGYAAGGAVSGGNDLHASVMADYGQYFNQGGEVQGYAFGGRTMATATAQPGMFSVGNKSIPELEQYIADLKNNKVMPGAVQGQGVSAFGMRGMFSKLMPQLMLQVAQKELDNRLAASAPASTADHYTQTTSAPNIALATPSDMPANLEELNAKYYVNGNPYGNSMATMAKMSHGGAVPGYAQEGFVNIEDPAPEVDGGPAFAEQYAQGQLDYPVQQDAPAAMPVARASGTYPVVGNDTINALVTKYGGLGDDAIRQLAAINTERTKARQDYNTQIAKLENMAPQGPSDSERWFNRAAAFLDPGKTGSFGEGLQHMSVAEAANIKAKREYDQEFMKNKIMAGLKRGEFTMEDLARQEKSTVDMAQLGITSQEKLAALMEKINAGEKERLAGISVHFNDANGEIVVADKGTNSVTVLRQADIPENVRLEIMKNATARAESYEPADKPARIAQFMKEGLEAYAKTRVAIKLGTTSDIPPLAPAAAPTGAAPSLSGNTIPLKTGTGQAAPAPTAATVPAATSAAPSAEPANVGYTSPFGQYVVAPPRARTTTGEQTPQQKTEFEGQAAANLDEVKLFNTRVNEASAAGSAGVAAANQLLNVLPQIPNTGTLAPYRQQLGSVFGSLGIQGDITDSANMLSIAQAAVSSSVLGQQLLQKGVQTEGDAKRMEMAGPTLTQPKTAVEFLTRTAKATGLRQLEMSAFRDDWRRYNNTDLGMGDAWNKYINATPLTATLPNNKLIFINEYVDQYMKAHPTGTTEQRRGAALSNWRKLGGM